MAALHMGLPRGWPGDPRVAADRFSAGAFSIDFYLRFAIGPTATSVVQCLCPRLELWFWLFRFRPLLDWQRNVGLR